MTDPTNEIPLDLPSLLSWWAVRSLGSPVAHFQIELETENGSRLVVGEPIESDEDLLGDTEKDILLALSEIGAGDRMTGEQIALKAKYEFDSNFRKHLSTLVKMGRIRSSGRGYSVVS